MVDEGGIPPKFVLMTEKAIFSHVRYLFLFILFFISFSRISVQFGQLVQFGSGLVIYISGDELGSKFNYAPI